MRAILLIILLGIDDCSFAQVKKLRFDYSNGHIYARGKILACPGYDEKYPEEGSKYRKIGKSVPSYFTTGANLRLTDLFREGLYCEIHGTNLLNQDVMYPATTNNNGLFPMGTMGMGRQVMVSLGYKF
jgi:hypothetical protein